MKRLIMIVLALLALSACNLGQNAPPEPTVIGGDGEVPPEVEPATDDGAAAEGAIDGEAPVATDPVEQPAATIPPTVPSEIPATEQIQSIQVEGTNFRTQEPLTIRVTFGNAVSNVNCSIQLQQTTETEPLGTGVQETIDENTQRITFTYTPTVAGDYRVNCNGIALTAEGQDSRSLQGDIFTIEAKG